MPIRIGINGFGRIGRNVTRVMHERKDFEIVAINDLSDSKTLAHLLKYDSTHGRFRGEIKASEGKLTIDGRDVRVIAEKDPANLPWKDMNIDFAIESTGVFTGRADIEKHIKAGAKKVLLTVPPKDEIDATIVMGVNHETLKASDKLISNASCTTNCVVPMVKVLHENFGIERAFMNTIHAYTNDQRILDLVHKDLRRARSAAVNIIPTSTGAAKTAGVVYPELKGKVDGMSMRVPVQDGSVTDFVAVLKKEVSAKDINAAFQKMSQGALKGVLEYSEEPLVSSDIIDNPHSCIFDALSTMTIGTLVKVIGWYDNEWGYSNRVADLIAFSHNRK